MSSSDDDAQDKSFDATPGKIKRAREKGNVPISNDLGVLMSYVGLLIGLAIVGTAGMTLFTSMTALFVHAEGASLAILAGTYGDGAIFSDPYAVSMRLIGPAAVLVVVGLILQGAIVFAPTKVKPDISRINPIQGLKKKYGPSGMAEFARSGGKIIVVSCLGAIYFWSRKETLIGYIGLSGVDLLRVLARELSIIIGLAAFVAAGVAAIDVPARRFSHYKRLRMSRQEVTDESKENEGDPTQKQARQRRAQEMREGKMLQNIPNANVVIVNPTHYAVALAWDRQADTVPVCLAKGVDHFAQAIIERARASGVPVREDPPCARALYATVDVNDPIKPEHFMAVAAAIRFADQLRPSSEG